MASTTNSAGCDNDYSIVDTHPIPPEHKIANVCQKPKDSQNVTDDSDQPTCPDGTVLQTNQAQPTNFFTTGQKGYGRPEQHPLFQTTSSAYGKHAPPPGLSDQNKPFVRTCKFTTDLAAAGLYIDSHLTNEKDKEFVYSPATNYYY